MAEQGKPSKGWGLRIYEARMAMKGRRGRKMSQAELAEATGVTGSQIGFYESEANEPGRDAWEAMAAALGVTPGWLAFGQEPREAAFISPYHREDASPRVRRVAEKPKRGKR